MIETLTWWLALTVIGALLLPLCLIALRRLPDRGYALSKPFGLLFVGYVFWLGNSAGLLPNSATGIVLAAIPLILVAAWFAQREREDLREWLHDHWRYIAVVEGLFFLVFVTAVWLRSTVGEITGTEQPMDLMFLNAATQADSFPPKDSWLSGETVAYYWFGYLLVAVMGKLSSVPTDAAYNIGLGMIAAMALTGAAGIVYGLVSMREKAMIGPGQPERGQAEDARARPQKPPKQPRRRQAEPTPSERGSVPGGAGLGFGGLAWKPLLFGLAGGLMLVVMGNLVYVLVFASAYGFGSEGFFEWVNIDGLTADEPRYGQWYPAEYFQFFGATRIIPLDDEGFRAITEFPMFSYLLGDLHPHVMALPFVLLVVGLALSLFRSAEPLDVTFWLQRPLLLLAAAVMLGALTFINTWDVATFGFLIVAAAFVSNFTRVRSVTADLFVQTLSFALPLLLLAFLFYVPFVVSISGNSQVNGISAVVTNSTLTHSATRPLHAFLFWGPLFVLVFPFVVARVLPERRRITFGMLLTSGAPAVIVVLGWIIVFFAQSSGAFEGLFPEENLRQGAGSIAGQVGDRGWGWLTYLGLSTFLGAAMLALCLELTAGADRGERLPAMFALTLTVVALLLVLGCEFFFVGDVFTSRMNTVFKLYYQAWLLLAVAAGYSLYYLHDSARPSPPRSRRARRQRRGAPEGRRAVRSGGRSRPSPPTPRASPPRRCPRRPRHHPRGSTRGPHDRPPCCERGRTAPPRRTPVDGTRPRRRHAAPPLRGRAEGGPLPIPRRHHRGGACGRYPAAPSPGPRRAPRGRGRTRRGPRAARRASSAPRRPAARRPAPRTRTRARRGARSARQRGPRATRRAPRRRCAQQASPPSSARDPRHDRVRRTDTSWGSAPGSAASRTRSRRRPANRCALHERVRASYQGSASCVPQIAVQKNTSKRQKSLIAATNTSIATGTARSTRIPQVARAATVRQSGGASSCAAARSISSSASISSASSSITSCRSCS